MKAAFIVTGTRRIRSSSPSLARPRGVDDLPREPRLPLVSLLGPCSHLFLAHHSSTDHIFHPQPTMSHPSTPLFSPLVHPLQEQNPPASP